MLPYYVALVSETNHISSGDLLQVAGALQRQVTRDFGPIWEVDATVSAYATLAQVPIGYWPVIMRDDIQTPGAAGVHSDKQGQPFALVQYSDGWSLTASHECLEMLGDPFGNRLVAGNSPKKKQGRVEFLVEVCDPSEDEAFAYTVNGVVVSDFFTPHFFDPKAAAGVRYSYTGAITKPRQVLKGGYLSWHDPVSDHWWQEIYFGAKPQFRDLGVLGKLEGSLRASIERLMGQEPSERAIAPSSPTLTAAQGLQKDIGESTTCKADSLHQQIAEILGKKPNKRNPR